MNGEPHGAGHRAEDDALTRDARAADDRFERDLRAVVRRHAPPEAPEALRAGVSAIAQPVRQPSPVARASGGGARRRWLQPATGLAAAVVVALIGGLLVLARPAGGPAASAVPSGLASATGGGVRALSAAELGALLASPDGTAGRIVVADLALQAVSYSCLPPRAPATPAACQGWNIQGLPRVFVWADTVSLQSTSGLFALRVQSSTFLDMLGQVTPGPDGLAWTVAQASHGGWTLVVIDAWLGAVNEPLPCPSFAPATPDPYGCGHAEWLADSPEEPTAQQLQPTDSLRVGNGAYAAYAPDPSSADTEHPVPQHAAYLVRLVPHSCVMDASTPLDACNFLTVVGRIEPTTTPATASPLPSPMWSALPVPSASAVPSAQSSPAAFAEIDQFGLVDATHGWALSRNQLYMTSDGGRTWQWSRAVASPGASITPAQVDFPDSEHGWAVEWRTSDTGPVTIERTTDFGRSWETATVPAASGTPRTIRFFDASHGLLALGSGGGRSGSLWRSSDGGATWTEVAAIPAAVVGAISFSSETVGWGLAASDPNPPTDRPTTNELYVTRDGGASWQRSVLPAPPNGFAAGTWQPLITAAPSAFSADGAVLAAWYGDGVHGETQLLVTRDAGLTWSVGATLPSLIPVPVDALSAGHWFAGIPHETGSTLERLEVTDDGGRTWRAIADPSGSPGIYLSIDFLDAQHGWLLDNGNTPLALYATEDGAASWRLLTPSGGPVSQHVCTVDTVVLGTGGTLAPATTPWFNVIVEYFDSSSPIAVTFSAPVVAWPGTPLPTGPLTAFSLPNGGTAKLSFRPADAATSTITVTASGGGCTATSTVSLAAPASPAP
ncbi:MAG: hypothetical protein M0Z49_07495 [Chloroflexi bacterium]|nr:hypothetical protein [Chloroflexota bacterium]